MPHADIEMEVGLNLRNGVNLDSNDIQLIERIEEDILKSLTEYLDDLNYQNIDGDFDPPRKEGDSVIFILRASLWIFTGETRKQESLLQKLLERDMERFENRINDNVLGKIKEYELTDKLIDGNASCEVVDVSAEETFTEDGEYEEDEDNDDGNEDYIEGSDGNDDDENF